MKDGDLLIKRLQQLKDRKEALGELCRVLNTIPFFTTWYYWAEFIGGNRN